MNRYLTATDGSTVYVTIDGDMVDDIASSYYGHHLGKTELIYENNPGLAERGPKLPAGVVIKLPQITTQQTPKAFRRLWD
ncbi:phage tail protein [Ensifer sp. MPMI2T]|nr:phage tail protein [Ensifer sp. MPMI2T]